MPVQKMEQTIGALIEQVTAGEIRLPELQREYVWKPTQVAKLVDSLYRGFPSGSLLFWEAAEAPVVREMSVGGVTAEPVRPPLYLLDGQQRLTSLHRVFSDHPQAQIVFHVEKERFQNQSAATRQDPKWVKVAALLDPATSMWRLFNQLLEAGCELPEAEIERRITRVRGLRERSFHVEVLKEFPYEQVAEIFVRVNSAGRRLNTLDLATATLSSRWPGVLGKLQSEADHWRRQGWGDIDVNFLSRAFAGAVLGGGLSVWSHGRLAGATDGQLEEGWATVRRGLAALVPLVKSDLGLVRSDVLPSMVVLIPLVVLLGERGEERLDEQTTKAIVYWLLVATVTARYSGSTDTRLSQDIRAARQPEPLRSLLNGLGVFQTYPRVTAESLAGRTKESAHFFLSLLAIHRAGARDWWNGSDLLAGSSRVEHHQIHPAASLPEDHRKAANDLANLVFVSAAAGRMIGSRSPRDYFADLGKEDLEAHLVPVDDELRDPEAFGDFLSARRRLLARSMTSLLDDFRPSWLDRLPGGDDEDGDRPTLSLVLYASVWDSGRLVLRAGGAGRAWTGAVGMADLERAVLAAADTGYDSDVEIAAESVPVTVEDDMVTVAIGPYDVGGTVEEWRAVFDREREDTRPLSAAPDVGTAPWSGERVRFAVADSR